MSESEEVDLSNVPISALRDRSKREIELLLNERRVLPTDEDIPRDWEGLVHLTNLDDRISAQSKNPTGDALRLWQERAFENQQPVPSLKDLKDIFCQLDRWDIVYDTEEMLISDAKAYKERLQLRPHDTSQQLLHGCLTDEDVERCRAGKELTDYDGFLLYADKDQSFAQKMKEKLETDYNLRIVVKDHLISGEFQVQALTNLITRCAALIVIVSPNLFKEPANNYLLGFAAAHSIEQRKSRIIPCKYEPYEQHELPRDNIALQYIVPLDYERLTGLKIDFFKKVCQSVHYACMVRGRPVPAIQNHPDMMRCTITEIEPQIQVAKPSEPSVSMDTKIVCMSDPSTHFPGNSLENSPDDGWSNHTSSSVSNTDSSFELLKKTEKKPSFLSKKKKWLKEKKWLRKKTPVALPC